MSNCADCGTELIIGESGTCQVCCISLFNRLTKKAEASRDVLLEDIVQKTGIPLDKLKGQEVGVRTG